VLQAPDDDATDCGKRSCEQLATTLWAKEVSRRISKGWDGGSQFDLQVHVVESNDGLLLIF
jgi:hypothetical protein